MANRYDILHHLPAYERDTMPPAREALAGQLVASGLLRIKADHARNFASYSGPGYDTSFSWRELTDPNLLPDTREAIRETLPGSAGEADLQEVIERLQRACKSATSITLEREMQLARLLVQACDPVIVALILLERVRVYVSYSHDVADLFPVHFWEKTAQSGGLQSISGDGTAVYVSCGGNPFIVEDEHKTWQSDGFAALARMQVIAAQELGHYADLQRTRSGRIASRHSATLMPLRAKADCAEGRNRDRQHVAQLQQMLQQAGVAALAERENRLAFFAQYRKGAPVYWWTRARVALARWQLRRRATHPFIAQFPVRLHGTHGLATDMMDCLADMAFNLAPEADAYRRDEPAEEEAIACIEALARVPQQDVKWSHAITQLCWPNLSALYHEQVTPANIAAYEALSGKRWGLPDLTPPRKRRWQKIAKRLK